jgi:hypothetical protein
MSRVSPSEVSVAVAEPRALLAAAVVAAARPAGCANALTPRQGPASRAGRRPAGLVGADMLRALLAATEPSAVPRALLAAGRRPPRRTSCWPLRRDAWPDGRRRRHRTRIGPADQLHRE